MAKLDLAKNLELAVLEIEKNFGVGAIMRADAKPQKISVIPTYSISLNRALGTGGIPLGKVTEIFGGEGAGKTTLGIGIMANAQKLYPEKEVAIIDMEFAFDYAYAKAIGLDINRVFISQPGTGEEALEITERLIRSQAFSCVVFDSTGAIVTAQELEGEYGDHIVGQKARLQAQAMRKIVNSGLIHQTQTALIIISQMRSLISPMSRQTKEPTSGKAIRHAAMVRIELAVTEQIKATASSKLSGSRVKAKIIKNKLAPPYKVAEMAIIYGLGISRELELIELGLETGDITKGGAWYSYNGAKYSGVNGLLELLIQDKKVTAELEGKVLGKLKDTTDHEEGGEE